MDGATIAGWIVAGVATATLWISQRNRTQDVSEAKLADKLKPLLDRLERHDRHHDKHFHAAASMQTLAASLEQSISDHRREDDLRFARMEDMHKEIRDDIKELLKRSDVK